MVTVDVLCFSARISILYCIFPLKLFDACTVEQEVPVTSDITTMMRISMPSETSLPSLYADTGTPQSTIRYDRLRYDTLHLGLHAPKS